MLINRTIKSMALFTLSQIESWERFYRTNFVNSLTGFKSINLIGTVDNHGQTNLGIFSSIVHIGSNPPLIGYINRPRKAATQTLANIEAVGMYTINHIQPSFVNKAHQTSASYPEEVSEFDQVGLTPELIENIKVPFVKESAIKYALSLADIIPIKLNDTFLVIGKIICVKIESDVLLNDGFLELDKAASISSNGNDAYYTTSLIGRYQYAKPGMAPEEMS